MNDCTSQESPKPAEERCSSSLWWKARHPASAPIRSGRLRVLAYQIEDLDDVGLAGVQLLCRALAGCFDEPAGGCAHAGLHAGLEFCWPSTLKATGMPKGCVFASRAFNCAGREAGGIEPDEAELGAATEGLRRMAIEVVAQRQVGILERLRELGGIDRPQRPRRSVRR